MFSSKMSLQLLFLVIIQNSLSCSLHGGNETDKFSLLTFKAGIIDDPLNIISSWNESLHFCEWSGVTCSRRHQRVTKLQLNSSKLVGGLTPHIGNMSFLRIINLQNNMLYHNIPPELGRLFRLQRLNLNQNVFNGEIPVNISGCYNLVDLELSTNNLTGKLPVELALLSNLQAIVFEQNNMVGKLPSSFGNLSSLEEVYGTTNRLNGDIPSNIGQLKRLKILSLAENHFSGTIPLSIYNLSSLVDFSMDDNQLRGSVLPEIGLTLPNLERFMIYKNQFYGAIPKTFVNASNLRTIQLALNNFTGKVPALVGLHNLEVVFIDHNSLGNGDRNDLNFLYSLANITNLKELSIGFNNLGGVLPEILSNFSTNLKHMHISRTQIRGKISTEIGNLVSLEIVDLSANQLTGAIPTSIGKLQRLGGLALGGNNISGNIPSSLGNITSLLILHLEENNLQGSIPSSLGKCKNLLWVTLYKNNLVGAIPKEVIGISSLSRGLDLSANQLTGSLPSEVGKMMNLGYLNLSSNRLSGNIPTSIASCTSLEYLYLERNFFQGPIPQSLSSIKAIQELNLSYNNFIGELPAFLAEFKLLKSLDLSFNDLEGEVPIEGVFQNASAVSVLGNKKLCGGIPQLNISSCGLTKRFSTKLILIIVGICGIVGIVLLAFSLLLCYFKKRRDKPASQHPFEISPRRVSYAHLLKATNGFSSTNLIGVGAFGSVYKGILELDNITVAVKVLNLSHKGASKSFMSECQTLASIKHRNLVKLLTVCSSIDFQGNDFKALIYQFIVNGSLEEWLHFSCGLDEAETNQPINLDLVQRLSIAIDVASAVDYLHHGCEMPIVHCDLKPSNVLLDADMIAHVGDFGLARFLPEVFYQLSANQSSSIHIKGTIGYAPSEYGMGNDISTYGDVYSYGILLLEMFIRKRPTNDMFKDGFNLHNYAKVALENNVEEVVDWTLFREDEEKSASTSRTVNHIKRHKIVESLISILKIGVACSEESPGKRMEITNVVAELNRIKNTLLRTTRH